MIPRVMIIGGTSLVGPHLVQLLLSAGYNVTTLTRRGYRLLTETALIGDRNDSSLLQQKLLEAPPDIVIDIIPFTHE